jgi:hypothetical protein
MLSVAYSVVRLPYGPSCRDVRPGNRHGRAGVDGNVTRFDTNRALGERLPSSLSAAILIVEEGVNEEAVNDIRTLNFVLRF